MGEQREIEDLAAQQLMAKATEQMVWISKWQLILTIIGTAALLYSISLNRAATAAAVSGSMNTLHAIKQEQQNAERQLRAYILPEAATIERIEVGHVPQVHVVLKNFGQTPARNVIAFAQFDQGPLEAFEPLTSDYLRQHASSRSAMGPLRTIEINVPCEPALNQRRFLLALGETEPIVLRGRVEYTDCFGHERWTTFMLYSRVVEKQIFPRFSNTMATASQGNDYY